MLFCRHYFSPLNTFMRKGNDPDPDPHLWLMDPDPGGPKTCGSCGSGFPTLFKNIVYNPPTQFHETLVEVSRLILIHQKISQLPHTVHHNLMTSLTCTIVWNTWDERGCVITVFAKFVSARKEVKHTVLYVAYSMQFNVFPKNPGTTRAEIY